MDQEGPVKAKKAKIDEDQVSKCSGRFKSKQN